LLQQLSENGKLVLPVGSDDFQHLQLLEKAAGQFTATNLGGCRFVPLIGS
jgi:protein-L-isoaspartate(D-aspartate) O-methyltransferase